MKKLYILLVFFTGSVLLTDGSLTPWKIEDTFNDSSWTNHWDVIDGTADLSSEVVQAGSALEVQSGSVRRVIESTDRTLWISFQARINQLPDESPSVSNSNTSVAFYVNTNGKLTVYNGKTEEDWTDVEFPIDTWVQFDIYCDYQRNSWKLGVVQNGATNTTDWLSFYSPGNHVESLLIANNSLTSVYIDDLTLQNTEPPGHAIANVVSANGLPEWWEKHFFNELNGDRDTVVSNGMKRWQAYIAGINPDDPDDVLRVSKADANGRKLGWNGKLGRKYEVFYAKNLAEGFGEFPIDTFDGASDMEFEDTDDVRIQNASGFYKIRVRKP